MADGAFITGGSRGIGLSIAEELARLGYSVALVSRNGTELAAAKAKLIAAHPQTSVVTLTADVSKREEVQAAFETACGAIGPVSVAVNNAGIFASGTSNISEADVHRLLDINLKGCFWVAQAAAAHFRKIGRGYLMNISSVSGVKGDEDTGGYSASKFGLMGLNQSLFRELIGEGIKVTAICPSWVDTRMTDRASMSKHDMIRPEDIAKTVEYLLSLSPAACPREIVIECSKDVT